MPRSRSRRLLPATLLLLRYFPLLTVVEPYCHQTTPKIVARPGSAFGWLAPDKEITTYDLSLDELVRGKIDGPTNFDKNKVIYLSLVISGGRFFLPIDG